MVFGKSRLELRVGIFVFVGLAIMALFILRIGKMKIMPASWRINFVFNFVNGVKIGAPVRFAGVDVGEVKELELFFDPQEQKSKIKIAGAVKNGVKIPSDSTVWVNTLGLLGEKYIEIMPGKDYAKCLNSGEVLIGNDPVAMHEVTNTLLDIADSLKQGVTKINNREGTIGKLIYDDTIYRNLEALTADIKKHPWKLFIKTRENK